MNSWRSARVQHSAVLVIIIIIFNSKPSGKREHFIVLHAGGKDGWVPSIQLPLVLI